MFDALCRVLCGSQNSNDALVSLRAVMRSDSIGIISASCCAPLAAKQDDILRANVEIALEETGAALPVTLISITEAQKALTRVKNGELEPSEYRLVEQIQSLVATQGLSIFPILIVNRKLAFYGGVPGPEKIVSKLTNNVVAREYNDETAAL